MRFVAAKADLSMWPRSVATWLVNTSCLKETDIAPQTAPGGTCRPPAFIPPGNSCLCPFEAACGLCGSSSDTSQPLRSAGSYTLSTEGAESLSSPVASQTYTAGGKQSKTRIFDVLLHAPPGL